MSVAVAVEPARQADVETLLRAGEAFTRELYSPDQCFLLSVDELEHDDTVVFVARNEEGAAVGMVALVAHDQRAETTGASARWAEIKRLFVVEQARGSGASSALMNALEQAARDRHISTLRLETGVHHAAALRFYARRGYVRIERFGPYIDTPTSVCMQRDLVASTL